jgi:hypothetical protein
MPDACAIEPGAHLVLAVGQHHVKHGAGPGQFEYRVTAGIGDDNRHIGKEFAVLALENVTRGGNSLAMRCNATSSSLPIPPVM